MKAVISYFIVLFSAFIYMIFFDARSGSVMLFFLIITITVSVFLTLKTRKHISFSFITEEGTLKKNEPSHAFIQALKDTVLPVPLITVTLNHSFGIKKPEYTQYRFSMSEKKEVKLEFDFIPEFSGPGFFNIEKIEISDYLGIFRFKMKNMDKVTRNVFVSPDIPEFDNNSEMLKMIFDSISESDDDDAVTASSLPGLPGYEYREYVPGDSLKRINWKLSSKRNQLFVRLDEAAGVNIPNIILVHSSADSEDNRDQYAVRDRMTEASLAVANSCVSAGVGCSFSFFQEGVLVTEEMNTPEDVKKLAEKLSHILPEDISGGLGIESRRKSSSMNIIFSDKVSSGMLSYAQQITESGDIVRYAVPSDCELLNGTDDVWIVNDDYSIVRS